MTKYDLHPVGDTSVGVRLYGERINFQYRQQSHTTTTHDSLQGADPGSTSHGLDPGILTISGQWLGSDAETIATDFRDNISDDPSVTRVELQAGENGSAVSSPYNGTYRITENTEVGQPSDGDPELWEYQIQLIED